jgi:hypothetical protein
MNTIERPHLAESRPIMNDRSRPIVVGGGDSYFMI